jgi:Bacteriocin-protection, YdeI or OmpD-Associated
VGELAVGTRSGLEAWSMSTQKFDATVTVGSDGRVIVPVAFDPNEVWGHKTRHHVAGTIDGKRLRAVVEEADGEYRFVLGPAWGRDCGVSDKDGQLVTVVLSPEGPQRADLDADFAAALEAEPAAGEFFDSIAQFYRKAYLTYIGATKRSPDKRVARIAEVVELLKAGVKQRPGT